VTRSGPFLVALDFGTGSVRARITGRNLGPEIFLAKLLWIRRHEPERYIAPGVS